MRIFLIALFVGLLAIGCNTTGTTPPSPNPPPVAPPTPPTPPSPPSPPSPPAPPSPPSPPSSPAPSTVGQLQITVSGLPSAVPAKIFVSGPGLKDKPIEASTTLSDLQPGEYTINTKGVEALYRFDTDPITQTINVVAGRTVGASVVYKAITGLLEYTYEGILLDQKPVIVLDNLSGGLGVEFVAQESPTVRGLQPGKYEVELGDFTPASPKILDNRPGFHYSSSYSSVPLPTEVTKGGIVVEIKAGETTRVHTVFTPITGSIHLGITGLPVGAIPEVFVRPQDLSQLFQDVPSGFINFLEEKVYDVTVYNMDFDGINYESSSAKVTAHLSAIKGQVVQHNIVYTPIDSKLEVKVSGVPDPTTNKPVRVTGPNFNSGLFGSSKTFTQLVPGSYTISAQSFTTGQPGKPSCRSYTPNLKTQTLNIAAGQSPSISVGYTEESCE